MTKTILTLCAAAAVMWTMTGCGEKREYSGSLVDEAGQPIRSALVSLTEDGEVRATGESDGKGNFEVSTVEATGWGCGVLSEGYALTIRRADTAQADFATLRGRHFGDLGQVKLLDQVPNVAIDDGTVTMTSTTLAMWIDDGLTWDVSGVGAMPIEALGSAIGGALGQGGKHTFRRAERQFVGVGSAPLDAVSPAVELTVPATGSKPLALSVNNSPALSDGSFAAINLFDGSSQTIELAERGRVHAIFLAGLRSDSLDVAHAIPSVEIRQNGENTTLSPVACSMHDTTVMCVGDYDNVDQIKVRLLDKNGIEGYFRSGEAVVY